MYAHDIQDFVCEQYGFSFCQTSPTQLSETF